ncbi:hypothetical protein CE91St1_13740 [Parabacteroides goldsteinii]|uniref:hypothetical protein n=1 Tax=Parabacteroides TaxID=375288 RepID=UPI000FE18554|nr:MULTISPECIES: hypothetical protein [Parabacteroides]GKG72231.1 hypothetical protein CE91St1_13740 [Parabacteroides goldsteinii]GKG78671.1 hypothetical protein CE91St2_18630 [Parabacteroides goldsteinii]
MKKIRVNLLMMLACLLVSCGQRIEMDMSQWGDTAFIDNVQVFTLEVEDDFKMQEYYTDDGRLVEGVRQVVISEGNAQVDLEKFVVYVKLKKGMNLDLAGFLIYHRSMKVEPLNSSPVCGIAKDINGLNYEYRLYSADGTTHDWKIIIE